MKSTKVKKLIAVYERFGAELETIPDPTAHVLYVLSIDTRKRIASFLLEDPVPTSAEIVSGLEQGLREIPILIGGVTAEWRPAVTRAFQSAISAEYPEFKDKDVQCFDKILARGEIKTMSEFFLVRTMVDILEGDPEAELQLTKLYALLEEYEQDAG